MNNKIVIFLIGAPILGLSLAFAQVYYYLHLWKYQGPVVQFEISPGEGFSKINYRLDEQELISSARLFHRYSDFKGTLTAYKPGIYEINPGTSMAMLHQTLLEGPKNFTSITIPEGRNIYEIAGLLEIANLVESKQDFINAAKDPELTARLNIPAERVEGYLFPDTYFLEPGMNTRQIIEVMVREFRSKTATISLEHPTLSPHEIIILASMVEKETGAPWERPLIAGVFLNRLRKKMRLQSDPTTIYGIYETWKGNLRRKHLQETTPYNTYRINGLPKGPIANPGLESIKAVLEPEKHDYLYFVSLNDGTHQFSKTYKEHREAVERYQKNPAARQGKSWRDLRTQDQ